jgi:hypothetical protein
MMFHVPLILTPREREPIYSLLTLALGLALVDGVMMHYGYTIIITYFYLDTHCTTVPTLS